MSNIIKENNKYFSSVLQSVSDLHKTEVVIGSTNETISTFTTFLAKHAVEIEKFRAVEEEIIDSLKHISFDGNIDFSFIQRIIQPLPSLKQKLSELGAEAKKLVGKPDRYNCLRAMEICKKMTLFCRNEMKSADYDSVFKALENNIPKLVYIQKEFEVEQQILAEIKCIVSSNRIVLSKYSAFSMEIQQFINSFPNNRSGDLKTIEQRINALNNVDAQVEDMKSLLDKIKPYANRFNKQNIEKQAGDLLISLYSQMKFSDLDSSRKRVAQNTSIIKVLVSDFDKEEKEIHILRSNLGKLMYDMWVDDKNRITNELDYIVKAQSRHSNFMLQSFHNKIQSGINKKEKEITNMLNKYKWLRRTCYVQQFEKLRNDRNLTYASYTQEVETIRKNRGLFTKLYEMILYN